MTPRACLLVLIACHRDETGADDVSDTDVADTDVPDTGPTDTDTTPPLPPTVSVADGEDWTVPDGTTTVDNSGFFSESAAPTRDVDVRVLDLTWAQLEPEPGVFDTTSRGSAQGMQFPSFDDQIASGGPFWVRIWFSSTEWAPSWVTTVCNVEPITGQDYDGQRHLPIWDPCVWDHIVNVYDEFLVRRGLLADPDVKLVYVPGAFTWAEFDYDMINLAVNRDGLEFETYDAWFSTMVSDLSALGGPDAHKLVFTGEDYPYGPFGARDDLLARDAVTAGLGIRSGITEVSNNHLSEVPAYGASIEANGHLVTDEGWPLLDGTGVIAAENECFDACGYHTDDPWYAVRQANLKALQLRVNWLYVVPNPSFMPEFPDHWEWVRLELGRTPTTAFDAWAQLRDAEDRYWDDEGTGPDGSRWDGFPYVKNLERWLVQRDVAPDGVSRRGSEVHEGEIDRYNGTAYEGRSTDRATGNDFLYFDLDDAFLTGALDVEVKVTWLDLGTATWTLGYPTAGGIAETPPVTNTDTGTSKTATFAIHDASFDGSLPGGTDFRLWNGGIEDLEVAFVRVVKTDRR